MNGRHTFGRAGARLLTIAAVMTPILIAMLWFAPPQASAGLGSTIEHAVTSAMKTAIEDLINDLVDQVPVLKQLNSFVGSFTGKLGDITSSLTSLIPDPNKLGKLTGTFDCAFAGLASTTSDCLDSSSMIESAKSLAGSLYAALLAIELIMLGIQLALFRDNLAEFFASITMKVFVSSFFLWAIANANTLFSAVMNGFQLAAHQISPGAPSPTDIWGQLVVAAAAFYAAGSVAHVMDATTGSVAGISFLGIGDAGAGFAGVLGHENFILITQFLGFLILGAAAAIMLTGILITVESMIIMSAGIVFLGFAGSRFTVQYAQGYFSYCINIGVKMFAYYLVLDFVSKPVTDTLIAAGATLTVAAAVPFGAGGELATGVAALATVQVIVIAALVWFIPNLASSFLSGQSTMSTSAVLGNLAGAVSGMTALQAGMKQGAALHANATASNAGHSEHGLHVDAAPRAGSAPRGIDMKTSASSTPPVQFATPHAAAAPPEHGLATLEPSRFHALSDLEFRSRLTETGWSALSEVAKSTIVGDQRLHPIAEDVLSQRAHALEAQAATFRAQAAGGLRGMVPSGEAPPTAVQIRMSQPDKL